MERRKPHDNLVVGVGSIFRNGLKAVFQISQLVPIQNDDAYFGSVHSFVLHFAEYPQRRPVRIMKAMACS